MMQCFHVKRRKLVFFFCNKKLIKFSPLFSLNAELTYCAIQILSKINHRILIEKPIIFFLDSG